MTKEDALQIAVMKYIKYQYSDLLAWHTPNGGSRNMFEGKKLKAMGVLRGVPDVIILAPTVSIAIELKIKPNKPTQNQTEILNRLKELGWITAVCYDLESVIALIEANVKKGNNPQSP